MRMRQVRVRPGFTLVEMLIVIGIIATLAAISVGVFFQVQGSQESSVTEVTLNKLHSTFDGKYKVVLDDARKSVPPLLVTACGNDKDRALVVWTMVKLKNDFPQTKDEATRTYVVPGGTLTPRAGLKKVADALPAAATPEQVSAALIYAVLTQTGGGGTMAGSDGLQQQSRTEGTMQYFVDSWNLPIGFKRDATNTEIQTNSSYVKANRIIVNGVPRDILTPLDPLGKMIDLPANSIYRSQFTVATTGLNAGDFSNVNRMPTFYSAGPNKEFGTDPVSLTDDAALDNLLSYRLRREGARGD